MNHPEIVAVIVVLIAIIAQTGALFYWGGKVSSTLKHHDSRLSTHDTRIEYLERKQRTSGGTH